VGGFRGSYTDAPEAILTRQVALQVYEEKHPAAQQETFFEAALAQQIPGHLGGDEAVVRDATRGAELLASHHYKIDVRVCLFYRRGVVFAGLPRTRGFDSPSALIFKLPRVHADLRKRVEGDARIGVSMKASSKGWFSFELRSEGDLRDALFWLQHACEGARK
jgi:hypothetical protein